MKDFLDKEIRALSWKQPFATAMLHGKIETRTWDSKYKGMVLICTSLKPYDGQTLLGICGYHQYLPLHEVTRNDDTYNLLGYAIAIGELIESRPMQLEDEEKCFVEYYDDLFCHVYQNVKRIVPFKWKGSQGWSKLTDSQKQLIKIVENETLELITH